MGSRPKVVFPPSSVRKLPYILPGIPDLTLPSTSWLDPSFARPIMICDELSAAMLCDYDYSDTTKLEERYTHHYKTLSQLGEGRILRYRIQQGWDPLCEFLSVSVPGRPFPRQNDWRELEELGRQAWWTAVRNSARNVIGGAVVILMTSMALTRFGRLQAFV
jgi:hypothetical protein